MSGNGFNLFTMVRILNLPRLAYLLMINKQNDFLNIILISTTIIINTLQITSKSKYKCTTYKQDKTVWLGRLWVKEECKIEGEILG